MSAFPAADIAARMEDGNLPGDSFALRCIMGNALGSIDREYLIALVDAGLVAGIGSRQSIKYFQLVVDQSEVEGRLRSDLRDKCAHRARRPLDFLVGMLSSRSFISRDHETILHRERGEVVARRHTLFRHNLQRSLGCGGQT